MTINIRGIQIDLTEAIRAYVEEKFSSLDKYESQIQMIDIEVGRSSHHHQNGNVYVCSAHVLFSGDDMKIEREADDLYKAIDKVRDHLREALSQRKEKVLDARRKSDRDSEISELSEESDV
ncbi:ribosome-associated translation inhibitor RaiA [Candidatus Uhrbacteria bacterium]|nr:ribosome-associated translation inhibitor RaiA [Candidatus Uhrbacteria bacterium]